MKNITASVLLVLFLFSIANHKAAADQPLVVDFDGDPLRPGVEYYIRGGVLSSFTSGWLDLDFNAPGNLCPKIVIQKPRGSDLGRPVVVYPANTSESVIRESTDVNIMFLPRLDAYCRTSNAWRISNFDPSSGQWWVTHGGEIGNPGPQTLQSWFKFDRFFTSNSYYISHCPSVCPSCARLCNNVTRIFQEEAQIYRLGLAPRDPAGGPLNGWMFWFVKESSAIKQVVGN